jgi:hypothetical protein
MLILGTLLLDQDVLPLSLKTVNSLVVHPPNQTKDVTSNKVTHYVTDCHILKHHVGSIFLDPPPIEPSPPSHIEIITLPN